MNQIYEFESKTHKTVFFLRLKKKNISIRPKNISRDTNIFFLENESKQRSKRQNRDKLHVACVFAYICSNAIVLYWALNCHL